MPFLTQKNFFFPRLLAAQAKNKKKSRLLVAQTKKITSLACLSTLEIFYQVFFTVGRQSILTA
jgi:hypothetical protein